MREPQPDTRLPRLGWLLVGASFGVLLAGASTSLLGAQLLNGKSSMEPTRLPSGPPYLSGLSFGIDASGALLLSQEGIESEYASLWVGPWTLRSGWAGAVSAMTRSMEAGMVPAIHLYYWGDDISPACLNDGCWSPIHGEHKTPKGWDRLTRELGETLDSTLEGRPALVILETEFNKQPVSTYEPLDLQLASKANLLRELYPNATIVLGFGNWDPDSWSTWDRAVAASDYIGLQAVRGSTRDSDESYLGVFAATLEGALRMRALYDKPLLIHDLALSSYPEPAYEAIQAQVLSDFFEGRGELALAGVEAVLYRSLFDVRSMARNNHYGEAERFWGLVKPTDPVEPKPAARIWQVGVEDSRAPVPPLSLSGEFPGCPGCGELADSRATPP